MSKGWAHRTDEEVNHRGSLIFSWIFNIRSFWQHNESGRTELGGGRLMEGWGSDQVIMLNHMLFHNKYFTHIRLFIHSRT